MGLNASLRQRLMVLILAPLLVIACILGYWRYTAAVRTAEELFDRALLAATLAISRDITVSEGDALSVTTRDLIAEAAGGRVFYHVAGPDGSYVIGYGYPPVPQRKLDDAVGTPAFYVSRYRGEAVRALRLLEVASIGEFRGTTTVTVWQRQAGRAGFARNQALRFAALMSIVVGSVALVIWFGVNRGLRPLLDLENAIAARTSDDLSQIRRPVPREVHGIVSTLNALFGQVRGAIEARDAFISNAAHQLRNPVAGMLSLAEAASNAGSASERAERVDELAIAARRTARLTEQMLALERIRGGAPEKRQRLDLNTLVRDVAQREGERVLQANVLFRFDPAPAPMPVMGDPVMLEEAVANLIDNALAHGGPALSEIAVGVVGTDMAGQGAGVRVSVQDDGIGLSPADGDVVLSRFGQLRPSSGSGLGLSIVEEVATAHGGAVSILPTERGAHVALDLPLV